MRVAVIPAAGKGVRFHELGKNYAKTLLPYDGVPILKQIIDRLLPDFDEIRVVLGPNPEQLAGFIDNLSNEKVKKFYVPLDGVQGPARSFMFAVTGQEDLVFLHLSDTLFECEFPEFSSDWVSVMDVANPSRWCMIDHTSHLMDKPMSCPKEYRAITGAYCFSNPSRLRAVFEDVFSKKNDDEFQLSEIFEQYNVDYPFRLEEHSADDLLDFGTIDEFYKNNKSHRSRYFNTISYSKDRVKKSSPTKPNKIMAEAFWISKAPSAFQHYLPKIFEISYIDASYEMERLHSIKLRDLFIHLDRSAESWTPIFKKTNEFLTDCKKVRHPAPFWSEVCDKTLLRRPDLDAFVNSFKEVIEACGVEDESTFFHGDLHFNNMFFDFSAEKLTLIDPNGAFFGHWLYDVAKLCHSVIGKFDFIDTRLFSLSGATSGIYSAGTEKLESLFERAILDHLTQDELRLVYKATASLFASMQPLHRDYPEKLEFFEAAFKRFDNLADNL
jgi:dTDP-glucose pyrophosphorylase